MSPAEELGRDNQCSCVTCGWSSQEQQQVMGHRHPASPQNPWLPWTLEDLFSCAGAEAVPGVTRSTVPALPAPGLSSTIWHHSLVTPGLISEVQRCSKTSSYLNPHLVREESRKEQSRAPILVGAASPLQRHCRSRGVPGLVLWSVSILASERAERRALPPSGAA